MSPGDHRHLRVAVETWQPWCTVTLNGDGSVSSAVGIAVDIFETVLQKMNYSYTYVNSVDGTWGRLMPNGTWTGMIGMTVTDKVDAALGPFVVSYDRSKVVDYSEVFYVDNNSIFLPKPIAEKDLSNFSKPFSSEVWLVLAIVFGISVVIGLILNHLRVPLMGGETQGKNDLPKTPVFKPVWIFSNLLNEPSTSLPTSSTGQMYLGTWLIVAFIIDTAYVGVLTSILAVPKVTTPVDSMEDLVSYGKMPWYLEQGTALHQELETAEEGIYKEVYDGRAGLLYSCYRSRSLVRTERVAIFCDTTNMWKAIHDDFSATGECHYHIARNYIYQTSMAFVFQEGSPITKEFDKWLAPLKESGIIIKQVLDEISNATTCLKAKDQNHGQINPVLVFMDLAGVFIVWLGGLFTGLLVFIGEILVKILKQDIKTSLI